MLFEELRQPGELSPGLKITALPSVVLQTAEQTATDIRCHGEDVMIDNQERRWRPGLQRRQNRTRPACPLSESAIHGDDHLVPARLIEDALPVTIWIEQRALEHQRIDEHNLVLALGPASDRPVVEVGGRPDREDGRFTTRSLLLTEQTAINAAVARRDEQSGVAKARAVSEAISRRPSLLMEPTMA